MKNLITILALCGGTLSIQASGFEKTDSLWNVDPVYVQLFGGVNKSANENLPFSEFSSYPLSMGFFVGIGKEFSPLWGWRIALRYNHNKSRNVEKCESQDTWGWNNLGLFGDLTFDITDALTSKVSHLARPFNLKAFVGVGAAYTFGFDEVPLSYTEAYSRKSQLLPAARIGLTATYRVAEHWRVGAELSQTAFTDAFNGVKAGIPFDTRTNLKLGVSYVFGKNKKVLTPEKPAVPYAGHREYQEEKRGWLCLPRLSCQRDRHLSAISTQSTGTTPHLFHYRQCTLRQEHPGYSYHAARLRITRESIR